MSTTISVEEAQAKLPELIAQLAPGEEVVITSLKTLNQWPNSTSLPQRSHVRGLATARAC